MKKNENVRELSKFAEKKGLIEILEQTFSYVSDLKRGCSTDYRVVGEEQRTRNGELCWKDEAHTIPEMKDKWDFVDVSLDEMDNDKYAKYVACDTVLKALEALI